MFRTTIGLGVAFLVIALIAGLFGFIGVGSLAWEGAKIFFFIFLVLAVLAFVGGFFFRRVECLTGESLSSEASRATAGKTAFWPSARKKGWRVPAPLFLAEAD